MTSAIVRELYEAVHLVKATSGARSNESCPSVAETVTSGSDAVGGNSNSSLHARCQQNVPRCPVTTVPATESRPSGGCADAVGSTEAGREVGGLGRELGAAGNGPGVSAAALESAIEGVPPTIVCCVAESEPYVPARPQPMASQTLAISTVTTGARAESPFRVTSVLLAHVDLAIEAELRFRVSTVATARGDSYADDR